MKKLVILLVLLVVIGAVAGTYVYTSDSHSGGFRTVQVERGDLLATINATGTVEPEEVIDVGAQVAGLIREFGRDPRDSSRPIDYGSPVEKNTILAQIDDSLYSAVADHARAALGQAQANVEK